MEKMVKVKLGIKIFFILQLIFFLGYATYAWVTNRGSAEFIADNISVSASEGLLIVLPDGTMPSIVNINQLIENSQSNYNLSQVSSSNGIDFFKPDPYYYDETGEKFKFVKAVAKADYIDLYFYLKTEESAKHIYFDTSINDSIKKPYSRIDGVAANAIRVGLVIDDKKVIIIGDKAESLENPITNPTMPVIAEGYSTDIPDIMGKETNAIRQTVNIFEDFNSASKNITTMSAYQKKMITLRIWLEGGDYECTNEITGSDFSLGIKFASDNVKLDNKPPLDVEGVSVNNLSEKMEYSLDNGNTWYNVNSEMINNKMEPILNSYIGTLFVRYKESGQDREVRVASEIFKYKFNK